MASLLERLRKFDPVHFNNVQPEKKSPSLLERIQKFDRLGTLNVLREVPGVIKRGIEKISPPTPSRQEIIRQIEQERGQSLLPQQATTLAMLREYKDYGGIRIGSKIVDPTFTGTLEPVKKALVKNTFKGLSGLSTKLIEKFRGLPNEITPQQFNEVINKAQKEGIKKVDLDMVREAAERQGGGTKVLHGTGVRFDSFDDSMRGSLTGAKSAKGAIWFTDDMPTARAYSVYSAEEGVVKKALDEADKLEKIAQKSGKEIDWKKYDTKVAEYEELATYENSFNRRKEASVKEATIKGDLYEVDAKGKSPQELSKEGDIDSWLNEQIDKAKKLGKDGLKITNLDDAVGLYNRPATHYAIFDAKNISTKSTISLPTLAKDVEKQLVPLTPTPVKSPRWSNVGEDYIGDGKYGEIVYQSPIKTSAGDIHFPAKQTTNMRTGLVKRSDDFPNYFSNVRYEDKGTTRKLMEVQSDLMQKENFAKEAQSFANVGRQDEMKWYMPTEQKEVAGFYKKIKTERLTDAEKARWNQINENAKQKFGEVEKTRLKPLTNYESNDPLAHLRTFREEVKRAAKDGKDTLLVPTGETAMKIEGLGENAKWAYVTPRGGTVELTPQNLKVGQTVNQGDATGNFADSQDWIITDILGDGKFKAVPKDTLERAIEDAGIAADSIGVDDWLSYARQHKSEVFDRTETFDISGKVDTKHFVYKLNEEAIPKEARKQGLIVEGKVSQDNGEWWKIKIPKERANAPVEAFGAVAGIETDEEGKLTFDPTKAAIGIAGVHVAQKTGVSKYVDDLVQQREAIRKTDKGGVIKNISNFFAEAKKKLIDFTAPIEDTLYKAQKIGKVEGDITSQIDRALRAPTIAGQFARDEGLERIIKEVDNIDEFEQFLIARHAKDVEAQGFKTGRDLVKDAELVEALKPKYEVYAKEVNAYSRKLLNYAVDAGLVSKETATMLVEKYPNYVPINRVFSELEKGEMFGTKAVASLSKQTVVQGLKGSERAIESPIESLLAKTNDAFGQGEKNKAARILTEYKNLPGNPFKLRLLEKGETAKHTISVFENGVKKTYETTEAIANAAKNLHSQQLNILGKIFALPVRLAKLGITGINLPFVGANVVRDQLFTAISSDKTTPTSILNPVNFVRAFFSAVKHDDLYKELVRQGGGGTSFDIARNAAPQTVERIRAGKTLVSKALYTARHPSELLRAIEDVVSRSEEFTRLTQYRGTKEALIKQGISEAEAMSKAAKAARENSVNFMRRGEWGQVLNSAFLYINAGIQGSRTVIRSFQKAPKATTAKIAVTLFFPSAIMTAWNLSDPERKKAYEDIADYEKENNFIIMPPNPIQDEKGKWNVIKIPLPQGFGALTSVVRRSIEQAYGLDPVAIEDIANAVARTVSPIEPTVGSVSSAVTPQAIRPSVEALTNKNLFTGLPQVPQSMEKLSPELQTKSYTSGTARLIGNTVNFSPIKVEEFIKGTGGGVASQALNVSDRILAGVGIIPKNQIGGQNIIEAIAARFTKARGGETERKANVNIKELLTKQADERFLLTQEAELLYDELKMLPPKDATEKSQAIKQENPALYKKLKEVKEDADLGLTYNDRLIKQLGVENGERAKFIFETMQTLTTSEEKQDYYNELRRKKIISKEVNNQLKKLLSTSQTTP